MFTKETERKRRTRARSIHISARQNCWRRPRDNVALSTGGEPYQFKHLKAMAWITSIHYMMCPWIEDSKINLGSGAGRSGNIWAEMLKSITALFFYSPKTVMHTKAGMRLSDDPSSSWRGWGCFLKDARVYALRLRRCTCWPKQTLLRRWKKAMEITSELQEQCVLQKKALGPIQ